jgi:hypothetical protein
MQYFDKNKSRLLQFFGALARRRMLPLKLLGDENIYMPLMQLLSKRVALPFVGSELPCSFSGLIP